ncbi:MAG: hypothetical protein M1818_001775 [Claussenomyces sp. TS43310]|nr:MAG: hypothetical protein M1818_001775 [Claussenomyces sp. TS43310]
MAIVMFLPYLALSAVLVGLATAHGGEHQKPIAVPADANWATRHMAEEHHISNFDAGAFFTMHDFNQDGSWDAGEILKLYGLKDESTKDVPPERRDEVVSTVLKLVDLDGDGTITKDEWMRFNANEDTLPDFGLGPGHHGDDEYEYEIHHWEKYHDENTKEEDLTHPEDIAHFKKHDEMDDEADRVAALNKMAIVEQNIPKKFKRD